MTSDILIVGSGAAGLTAALNLAERFTVTVLAKGALNEGSTAWAQGGIAGLATRGLLPPLRDPCLCQPGIRGNRRKSFLVY